MISIPVREAARRSLVFAAFLTSVAMPLSAQAQGSDGPAAAGGGQQQRPGGGAIVRKLRQERAAIRNGVANGTISPQQAQQLKQNVQSIAKQAQAEREQNGGTLNQTQFNQLRNELRQTKEMIQSTSGAGTSVVQGKNDERLTGPNWSPGPDGAQNPAALKQNMKSEERRELRQERQATEQVQEQQQLDYDKQMTQKLGGQRRKIMEQKQDLQKVRNQNQAN